MIRNYFFTFLLLAICCQHSHAAVRYVNANVQGGGQDGTSWANAYPLLQSAIIASQYGDTIWVAHGTYRPTTGTNRNLSFSLKNGVRLFGGFSGTESSISERAWATYITTLSGDIGVLGDSTDNTYNVVYCNFADSTTILDGFTITGGNADSQASGPSTLRPKSGGGLYLVGSSILEDTRPTIANCTFLANYARFNGGGIFMRTVLGAGATPILKNCRFQDNTAANGGGIYKEGGSMLHETKVDSCTFIGNYAIYGGGFFFYNNNGVENVVIIKCDFRQNQVFAGGGGIYQEVYNDKCKMKIGGSYFTGNSSLQESTAIGSSSYIISDALSIDSCSFISNTSQTEGPLTFYDGQVELSNSMFISNIAFDSSGYGNGGCFSLLYTKLIVYNESPQSGMVTGL